MSLFIILHYITTAMRIKPNTFIIKELPLTATVTTKDTSNAKITITTTAILPNPFIEQTATAKC